MPLVLLLLALLAMLPVAAQKKPFHVRPVKVRWADSLPGDFSFRQQWSYPPNVSLTADGSLLCTGICPPQLDAMVDVAGHILRDSVAAYYRIVDTTHLYHTLRSQAHTYEWAGADYIAASRRHDTLAADTYCHPATHSSLRLRIVGDKCYARIIVNSINGGRQKTHKVYYYSRGSITIDSTLMARGILKAQFDFTFRAPRGFGPMYWRGQVYKTIGPAEEYEGMWLN